MTKPMNLFAPGSIDLLAMESLHREEFKKIADALAATAHAMARAQAAYEAELVKQRRERGIKPHNLRNLFGLL